MTASTVLVLGANGRIGAAAVHAFAGAGWRVLAQARRAPTQPLPPGATAIDTPMADIEALAARAASAHTVVYAVNPIYTRWDAELLPLARQGMALAERLGALFMLPGNIYNFGAGMPARLREDTPQRPTTLKGRQRCQLEDELQARAAHGLASVVIRAGDFYGAGRGSWLDQAIVKDLGRGKLVYPGPLDLPHTWAYLPDLARAFVAVVARATSGVRPAAPPFQRLHFAGHTLTGAQLLDGIEQAAASLGLRPARGWRRAGMPWGFVRTVGIVYPIWRELARMSYLWRVPHQLDGSALREQVGELAVTPLPVALRETLLALGFGQAGEVHAMAR